jgi:hypothetical protein
MKQGTFTIAAVCIVFVAGILVSDGLGAVEGQQKNGVW